MMKKKNPPGPVQETPSQSADPRRGCGQKAIGRGRTSRVRRPRGRIEPSVLAMLGGALRDCFEDARKQEMPERLKTLLQRF
jgi:hypothetical protein